MHNPARYVFLTDENYINTLLTTFKEPKDVTIKNLQEFFSNKIIRDENEKSFSSSLFQNRRV